MTETLALERATTTTLFQTDDPVDVLAQAGRVALALKDVLARGGMVQRIGAGEHVKIDGWQTLGSMLGVSAHVVWSRPLESEGLDGQGWEARAEARTLDGRVISAAEAMCTRAERNWRRADDYAVRSMAQTRAMSKALRGPLGFVITLAGHDATPAEEMAAEPELPPWAQPIDGEGDAIDLYGDALRDILARGGHAEPESAALRLADAMVAECDGTVPVCVSRLARRLQWALSAVDSFALTPEDVAAAPDVPPVEGGAE